MFKPVTRMLFAGAILALPVAMVSADVNPNAGMIRYPDVGPTHIVFMYANDLWLVPREGGQAVPLSSPAGSETFPRFSDDGQTIAFSGNYDGNTDIYTIPVGGGIPTRVTHHPAGELLSGWTPDGKLIFSSNSHSGLARAPRLFTVNSEGGLPVQLPVPYGVAGTISEDGVWLAYTPHNRDSRTWKRYRGGMASDIWLFNLNDLSSEKITDWEGTDSQPMWHGSKVYYMSDGGDEHRLNIWSYDTRSKKREQITRFTDYDIKWPSIGPGDNGEGEIVFQNGSSIYLLNLRKKTPYPVNISIPGDRPSIRTRAVDVSKFIQGWGASATGKRAVIQARGDIWTAPADKGEPRNLTHTSGIAERDPSWSPDGRWIAYFSDATDEYELYITQSDGKGETKQLTSDGTKFRFNPVWSPDSKMITFTDKGGSLYLHTIEAGETTFIAANPFAGSIPTISWSHDSRWLAYDHFNDDVNHNSIWIYNVESGETTRVTDPMFDCQNPAFDRKGDYLYYKSARVFAPTYSDLPNDSTFVYKGSEVLLAVPLRKDMDYVWAPESDEESWGDEEETDEDETEDDAEEDDDSEEDDAKPAEDDGVSGSWSGVVEVPDMGLVDMTLTLTLQSDGNVSATLSTAMFSGSGEGTYDAASGSLILTISIDQGPVITFEVTLSGDSMTGTVTSDEGDDADINFTRSSSGGGGDENDNGKSGKSEKARETVDIDFDGFERRAIQLPVKSGMFGQLAVNHKNQLIFVRRSSGPGGDGSAIKLYDITDKKKEEKEVAKGGAFDMTGDGKKLLVVKGGSASMQKASAGGKGKNIKTSGMTAYIDPHQEWTQMFNDTWRIFRDYFYLENMHGVDWPAMRERYGVMVDDCVSRDDLNFVIGELIAELNCGHSYRGGGDLERATSVGVGMLGCDYELDNGAYRITKIHEGGVWDSDARGPLSQPGVDVNEGDYLLAINGTPLDATRDPWSAFIGLSGKVVSLTVSEKPEIDDEAREVLVKPIGSESNLRYRSWIEANRAYVEKMTDGKIGYIYVPNTGINGQNDLFRQFFGQQGKEGLIIDERWNGGGQIPTRFVELLNRPNTNYWAVREGKDWAFPPDSHQGPKCMLINGMAGSGGDMFPWLFKQAGLGKLIGMRTWGGLVGLSGNPRLIDNGFVGVPTFGFYESDGTWGIEGHGTDPDIEVIDDPALMVTGGDPQLDAAIEHMLQEIETNGYHPPARPESPDRSGMGVREEDK